MIHQKKSEMIFPKKLMQGQQFGTKICKNG